MSSDRIKEVALGSTRRIHAEANTGPCSLVSKLSPWSAPCWAGGGGERLPGGKQNAPARVLETILTRWANSVPARLKFKSFEGQLVSVGDMNGPRSAGQPPVVVSRPGSLPNATLTLTSVTGS